MIACLCALIVACSPIAATDTTESAAPTGNAETAAAADIADGPPGPPTNLPPAGPTAPTGAEPTTPEPTAPEPTAPEATTPEPTTPEPTTPEPPTPWQRDLAALIDRQTASGTDISISIASDQRGAIYDHQAGLELWPASNQKILTAIGALELLPPDHRFTTTFATSGTAGGALTGDLVVIAGGDPTLTSLDLRGMVDTLVTRGVRHIQGDLVVDASRYETATTALGWQDWQVPTYVGPMSAFMLDDNRWRTDAAYLADPALGNLTRLADFLGAAGVQLDGTIRTGAATAARVFVEHTSAPVAELLPRMLGASDNEIAESLIREIGFLHGDDGSTPAGLAAIRRALAANGFLLTGTDGDGSGLSRANYRSATNWRDLLAYARSQPWAEAFTDALPVSGVSGTLAGRLTGPATAGRITAKTGTIIGGRALSGYAVLPDGDQVQFSIVVNGPDSNIAVIDAVLSHLLATPPPLG